MEYKHYSGPCGYTTLTFDSDEFHDLMTDFKAAAENRDYTYIKYDDWRNLWKWPFVMEIEIYGYKDTVRLSSLDDTSCPHIWEYNKYDDSLGSFLYKFVDRERIKRETMISGNDYLNVAFGSTCNCADKAISSNNVTNGTTSIDYSSYTISADSICYDPIVTESTLVGRLSEIENKIQDLLDRKVEIYDFEKARDNLEENLSTKANYWEVNSIDNDVRQLARKVDDIYNIINSYVAELRCNDSALVDDVLKLKSEIEELKNANTIFNEKNTDKPVIQFKNNEYIKTNSNKENEKMKNFVNFDFGPCTGDNVRMSMYGLAVKNVSGTWVSYDAANHAIMDVDVFNFNGAKFLYKMPVAIKDIKVGQIVIHARKPMFVVAVAEDGKTLTVVDPVEGEKKDIMVSRSPFGFDFCTCVVNLLGNVSAATSDCPFGNMWMLMMMDDDSDMSDMLLPMMMMNGGANMGNMNPMMMAMLMGDKGDIKDMLPWMFMMNSMPAAAPATAQ